jgi:hypothetical protein
MNSLLVDQHLFQRYDDIWLAVNETAVDCAWSSACPFIPALAAYLTAFFKHQITGRTTHDLHDL